jgi:hypothetical protein
MSSTHASTLFTTLPEREVHQKIKGCAYINGILQRKYTPKVEVALPTVATEPTFITAAIVAKEKRKVQCYDIPSVFVNTNVDKDVLMVLRGELADMMVQIAPQVYRKHVTMDRKGMPTLYVKLQKVLYGLMRASLLFYRKLRKELEDYRFNVNPYDPCMVNKVTECGKQMTVICHMDNLMGSCEDEFELTKFSCYLAKIYGPKLSMHTGQKHDYFGVDMEFNDDGTLHASMITCDIQISRDDYGKVGGAGCGSSVHHQGQEGSKATG